MEGRLDAEELAERVSDAYDAKFCADLDRLTADVTPAPAAAVHHPAHPVFQAPARTTNGLAIAALVFSLIWMGWIGSVLGVVLGHISLRQIAASRGAQTG